MLKRSEIVALSREAIRRASAKEIGVVPATKQQKARLAQLKAEKANRKTAEAVRRAGKQAS